MDAFRRKTEKTKVKPREEVASEPEASEASEASAEPLPPLPAVRKTGEVSLAKPVGDAAFMGGQSRRAAISLFRELMRELVGPMSDKVNEEFEAHWNEVMDLPSTNVNAWIEKALPYVSELVQLKAAMNAAMVEYDETFEEARAANEFGAPDRAHELMGQLGGTVGQMDAVRRRMKKVGEKLAHLGPMPKPAEEAKAARRDTAESRKVLAELLRDLMKEPEPQPEKTEKAAEPGEYYVLTETIRTYDANRKYLHTNKDEETFEHVLSRETDAGDADWFYNAEYGLQGLCDMKVVDPWYVFAHIDNSYKFKMVMSSSRFSYDHDCEVIVVEQRLKPNSKSPLRAERHHLRTGPHPGRGDGRVQGFADRLRRDVPDPVPRELAAADRRI